MGKTLEDGYWTREYGCVRCQKHHREADDRRIFVEHLFWQSKHGIQNVFVPFLQFSRRQRLALKE